MRHASHLLPVGAKLCRRRLNERKQEVECIGERRRAGGSHPQHALHRREWDDLGVARGDGVALGALRRVEPQSLPRGRCDVTDVTNVTNVTDVTDVTDVTGVIELGQRVCHAIGLTHGRSFGWSSPPTRSV